MQILVSIDGDGHFMAAYPSDRKSVIKLLESINDGDYYYDIINDNGIKLPSDISTMCCQDWDDFIQNFTQRGMLEYVEIPNIIPKACECV